MRLTIFLFLLSTNLFAQSEVGYITMRDGVVHTMYDGSNSTEEKKISGPRVGSFGPFLHGSNRSYYFDKQGHIQKLKNKEIASVDFTIWDVSFFPGTHSKGQRTAYDLHRVVARNDDYVLDYYKSSLGAFLYLHSTNGKLKVKRLPLYTRLFDTAYNKKSLKKLKKVLPKYFPNCTELFEKLERNHQLIEEDRVNGKDGKLLGDLIWLFERDHRDETSTEGFKYVISNIKCSN